MKQATKQIQDTYLRMRDINAEIKELKTQFDIQKKSVRTFMGDHKQILDIDNENRKLFEVIQVFSKDQKILDKSISDLIGTDKLDELIEASKIKKSDRFYIK